MTNETDNYYAHISKGTVTTQIGAVFTFEGDVALLDLNLSTKEGEVTGERIFLKCENDDKLVLKIMLDGSVVYGDGYTADEAAKAGAKIFGWALANFFNDPRINKLF